MQNSCSKDEVTYAGFWVRAAAYVIDQIVVFVGLLVVRLILAVVMSAANDTVLGGNLLFQYNLKDIILYILEVLYFILFTYYTGTTLGKKVMNLRVVNEDGEEKLSLLTVVYRETIGRFLCSVIAGIGYLLIGLDGEKRGLHDILCDTRVIYAKKVKIYQKVTEVDLQPAVYHNTADKKENCIVPEHSSEEKEETLFMPWETSYTPKTETAEDEKQPAESKETIEETVERDS